MENSNDEIRRKAIEAYPDNEEMQTAFIIGYVSGCSDSHEIYADLIESLEPVMALMEEFSK